MQYINRAEIIELVLYDLETTTLMLDYAETLKGALFPIHAEALRTQLTEVADSQRVDCDRVIRSIGGITVNFAARPETKLPITVIGVEKYESGNWHFPVVQGRQMAKGQIQMPIEWLRSAYTSFTQELKT